MRIKLNMVSKIWVLFLWAQTLTFVKCQECTLDQFLKGPMYDTNFDTTGMDAAYRSGRQVRVPCNVGYTGFFMLLCLEGNWRSIGSKCQSIASSCEIPNFENAEIVRGEQQSYTDGDKVTYRCLVQKSYTATCEQGTWTENSACSASDFCEKLQDAKLTVKSTMVKERYDNGEVIEYVCNAPGTIPGGRATCVNSNWSKTVECPAIPCEIGTLTTGLRITGFPPNINKVKAGLKLRFICIDNHNLEGSEETECLETGQWKDPFPTCSGSVCRNPPLLENGDTVEIIKPEYQHNERVRYMCQHAYTMQGEPYKTCTRGVWTGEIKCLRPCTVDAEEMNRHNIQFVYASKIKIYAQHNDYISFACKFGKTHVGSGSMRKICIDGVIDLPTCQ